jgi:processive 1,2-diacylglycerol beta-glucosyltransferase/1,2-diacylglycerol 3-beta-galactosyltransferase
MCKPLIISTYIHGQELGNMRFVVKSGAGWFIQKPKDIFKKLVYLAENPEYAAQAAKNAHKLDIRAENAALVDFVASL